MTSVPSDAPDDYVALKELVDKPLWREKFGLTAEMVEPFAVVPIIGKIHKPLTSLYNGVLLFIIYMSLIYVHACMTLEIEGYGSTSAVTMCERLDIKSSKDADKLKKAKDEVYLKGFYEGVMLVGECKGMKVGQNYDLSRCID